MKIIFGIFAYFFFATIGFAQTLEVKNCGEILSFDKTPERVVFHDINMAEMAFALGLQDKIIGLTGITGWYKTNPNFDKLRGKIPELAPKYPSLENLVAAAPDLFVAGWYYGMKPGGDVTPSTLLPHGIKTLILTESCIHKDKTVPRASLDLLFNDMRRLGKIFNEEDRSEELLAGWKMKLNAIGQKISKQSAKRVFLYDSGQDKPFTIGKYAISDALIAASGGKSVTSDLDMSWGTTSWETVAAQNPEFLVLLDYQNGDGAKGLLKFLQQHPVMKDVDAVKNENFIGLRYEELTPGPANINAIEKLAKALHPEAF